MWHRHPDSGDDAMVPASVPVTITRDDLIRLVVGMQWREMMGHAFAAIALGAEAETDPSPREAAFLADHFPPASDIVDEWLVVR